MKLLRHAGCVLSMLLDINHASEDIYENQEHYQVEYFDETLFVCNAWALADSAFSY